MLVPCTATPGVHCAFHLTCYADMPLDMRAGGATLGGDGGGLHAENSRLRGEVERLEQALRARTMGPACTSSVCAIL